MDVLSPDSETLTDLLGRIARADEGALRRLYDAAGPRLYAVALRVLGDPKDAGEAVEQTILTVWRHADQFDASGDPLAWLCSLTRERAIRRRRSRPAGETDVDVVAEVGSDEVLQTVFLEGLTFLELAPRLPAGGGPAKLAVRRALAGLGVDEAAGDDGYLAPEYALGLLDAAQRKAANARMLTDLALAEAVRGWNRQFEPFFDLLAPQRPPTGVWGRIDRRINPVKAPAATVVPPHLAGQARPDWRPWVLGAAGLIALCAVVGAALLILRQPKPAAPVGGRPMLAGRLMPPKGDPLFLATLDAARGEIVVVQSREVLTGGQVLRLWLKDGEGAPTLVGQLPPMGQSTRLRLPREIVDDAAAGGEVLVTLEPAGPPGDAPAGAVVASGALAAA
ncbi:MAG: anti-sigma factor [Caulobacteraceae bacterium]|nr:anti-sigma factor [Caulobacteraceae bacterium]